MKKSIKEQTVKAFQTGGAVDPKTGVYQVPGTGITGFQQAPVSTTGFTPNQPLQPYFQPTQFTEAQYQDPLQVTNIPTFGETVGSGFGQYDEERTYVNDAGQILKVPFKDGKPLFPIPEGYSEQGTTAPTEEAPVTTIPLTGQTTTRDTGGGKEDIATVTPTTKAARNVYKGYSKGYAGLSTAFGSGTGGLSEAAAQAKKDFGITGQQTGNLGSLASFVMAAAGVPLGIASLTAGKGGYLNDTPVTPGAIGTLSYQDLVGIANGEIPSSAKVSQEQAKNVLEAQFNFGVNLTGIIGYNSGDINPVTGTPVKNGMAVNSGFGPGATTASYATVADMKNVIEKGLAAGWRGGYIDKKAYDGLSDAAKENYNNFDNTHLQNEIIAGDETGKAQEAYRQGNQPMQDNITGTPTSKDVDKAFAAADAAADSGRETSSPSPERGGDDKSPGDVGVDASGASTGFGSGDECLTENMKVKLNGVIDFVTNIKVGDTIDGSIVKEVLHKHMRSGYFVINNELEITNDHPVWAKSGGLGKADWTRPEQLVVGDTINGVKVTSLNYVDRMTPTVAIVIDGDSFDVYTEGNTYTVHGRYREVRQEAA